MINFNNAEYDALIAKAAASTDDAEQTALYKEAAALLTTTAANIYVQDMADFMLVKSGVEGYVFYPMYVMDLATVHYVQ
jgi:peptide/nickel transport system substrate-binding protein